MKVLLREYAGEQYVWVDATKDMNNNFVVDGKQINETQIVSVSDYSTGKFVKCSSCGASIPNNKRAIEAHKNMSCDWHNCLNCKLLRIVDANIQSRKFVLQEDGRFHMSAKESVSLKCSNTYYSGYDITSEKARNSCRFAGCKDAKMVAPEDFFSKNPDAFDDLITIDKVIKNGYTETYETYGGDYTKYVLKAKNRIIAYVNKLNIVDHFQIYYRNDSREVVYSKKLDKLFNMGRYSSTYEKPNIWNMPDESMERVKAKIASLYE